MIAWPGNDLRETRADHLRFAKRYDRALLSNDPDGFDWVIDQDDLPPRSFRPTGALSLREFDDGEGHVGDWMEEHLLKRRHCPFCGRRTAFCEIDTVAIADNDWPVGRRPEDSTRLERYGDEAIGKELSHYLWGDATFQVWACVCGFWQSANIDMQGPSLEGSIATSKLATFPDSLPPGISLEIARALVQGTKSLRDVQPTLLEKLVASVFRANYEHADVRHVGRPSDGGVDVVLVESANSEWLVQVKHHVKDKTAESVTAVRHLLGTLVLEERTRGVVVSTADHFSHFAAKATDKAQRLGYEIELVDRGLLLQLLSRCMTDDGWLVPLREGKLFHFVKKEGLTLMERYLKEHFASALAESSQLALIAP